MSRGDNINVIYMKFDIEIAHRQSMIEWRRAVAFRNRCPALRGPEKCRAILLSTRERPQAAIEIGVA